MKKKIASVFLAVVLTFAMVLPVMAVEVRTDEAQPEKAVSRVMYVVEVGCDAAEVSITPFNWLTCTHGFTQGNCRWRCNGCTVMLVFNWYLMRYREVVDCPPPYHSCW